jgi:hypothetical protein
LNDRSGILSPESFRPGEVPLLTAMDAVIKVPASELPRRVALVRRHVSAALDAVPGTRRVAFRVIAQMLVCSADLDCPVGAGDEGG